MKAKLEDVCDKGTSNIRLSDVAGKSGKYPIYGASGYIGNVDFYQQENPYVAVVKDGAGIGRAILCPSKSSVIGTLQYLIPKNNILAEYLFYAISNMHLERYYSGATIPHIYFRDYKEETFNVHSMDEQKKIVGIFNHVEKMIELRKKEILLFDELIKSRFIELFGDPVSNPFKWEKTSIKHLVTVDPQNGLYKPQSDYSQDKSGVPILRIDAFYDGKITNFETLKRLKCSNVDKKRYLLKENDIVINRVNSIEYLGKCAHITGMLEDTIFESNMMRFHLDDKKIDAVFMTRLLCSKYIYNQILRTAKKSVNQASINQKDVLGLEVYMPPIELQKKFAAFACQVDKSRLAVQKSLDELEILKKSLLQEYFG